MLRRRVSLAVAVFGLAGLTTAGLFACVMASPADRALEATSAAEAEPGAEAPLVVTDSAAKQDDTVARDTTKSTTKNLQSPRKPMPMPVTTVLPTSQPAQVD